MKTKNSDHQNMTDAQMTALDKVPAGSTVRIEHIDSGASLNNRLAAMGLLKDAVITVIRNDGAGQLIVAVKSSKIILGRGMSHKVFVTSA